MSVNSFSQPVRRMRFTTQWGAVFWVKSFKAAVIRRKWFGGEGGGGGRRGGGGGDGGRRLGHWWKSHVAVNQPTAFRALNRKARGARRDEKMTLPREQRAREVRLEL